MTQYGLPISNVTPNDESVWSEGAGDGGGVADDAWDELDEGFGVGRGSGSGPDDATTYWIQTNPATASILQLRLTSSLVDPEVSSGHIIRFRDGKSASGGRQTGSLRELRQGSSTNITFFANNNMNAVWNTESKTLDATDTDKITDYSILRLGSQPNETGGGAPRDYWWSAAELEIPDPPSADFIFPDHTLNPVYRM